MQTITLVIKPKGSGFHIWAETETGPQSWSWTRQLNVVRGKAYLLAVNMRRRYGVPVHVVES